MRIFLFGKKEVQFQPRDQDSYWEPTLKCPHPSDTVQICTILLPRYRLPLLYSSWNVKLLHSWWHQDHTPATALSRYYVTSSDVCMSGMKRLRSAADNMKKIMCDPELISQDAAIAITEKKLCREIIQSIILDCMLCLKCPTFYKSMHDPQNKIVQPWHPDRCRNLRSLHCFATSPSHAS